MSWRTEGCYRGQLTERETEWLRDFDREWDRKAQGRSQTDALDHAIAPEDCSVIERLATIIESDGNPKLELESRLLTIARKIERLTAPREIKQGWSIRISLKTGQRMTARFSDYESALQAYVEVDELLHWFSGT